MKNVSVVLIEDHDLTRLSLQAALQQHGNIQILGEAASGRRGLELLQAMLPDVAVVDIGLPDMDGIELTRQFKQFCAQVPTAPRTKILILTMHEDENSVLAAFTAGADSYSLKDAGIDKLVEAIHLTHEGETWIDPAIARIVLRQMQKTQSKQAARQEQGKTTAIDAVAPEYGEILEISPLSERELEVLELIVAGYKNVEIAEKLFVAEGTVKTHVRTILNKLCADDRTQAAVRALRAGLVS